MTDRYVNPAVGSSGTGGSWAQAYKTLAEATAAAAAGETIYFANGTADPITADTTYTCADGVRVISTSDTTNSPPTTYATGATISTTTTGVDVTIVGVTAWHGVNFTLGDGTDANTLAIGNSSNDAIVMVDCTVTIGGTSSSAAVHLGATAGVRTASLSFVGCAFNWAATNQGFTAQNHVVFLNCTLSGGATHPATLFEVVGFDANVVLIGCDISNNDTVFAAAPGATFYGELSQCKLKASATIFSPAAYGLGEAFVYDCDSGDTHITLGHYSYLGSTTISTSVYASDNIADENLSWVVAGTAAASKATPYLSPWIPAYHTGTSAITPYLEILRSGSTTSYLESEAWIDVLAKVTSGSTKTTLYTNRAGPLDTTTDNTDSSKGAGDWTGEDASNNWYGKLILNASITPAEVGHIRARVGVAGEYTLYVDPQVRGLS